MGKNKRAYVQPEASKISVNQTKRRFLKPPSKISNADAVTDSKYSTLFSEFLYTNGSTNEKESHTTTFPNLKKPSQEIQAEAGKSGNLDNKSTHESGIASASSSSAIIISGSVGSSNHEYRILDPTFFQCDALELAPKLLGKLLRRDDVLLQITEVEAYRQNDSACHGRFGLTTRTAPMFGPGGHAYVYICYGYHVMLNVVADKKGVAAAVLVRSCAPVSGLETIQRRRGKITDKPILLTGPGKVGQALGLTTKWSNHPLHKSGGLEILDGPTPEKILVGPRVGINYAASEDVEAPWRFAIADSSWISAPRNTLKPV